MACWNKEPGRRNKPQRGRHTTDWHVLNTVSDLFLFMAENHWLPLHSQWCHAVEAITALYIYKIMYAMSKDTVKDDYVFLGQSGGLMIKTMKKIATNVQMKKVIEL